jgi:hypothetical protein
MVHSIQVWETHSGANGRLIGIVNSRCGGHARHCWQAACTGVAARVRGANRGFVILNGWPSSCFALGSTADIVYAVLPVRQHLQAATCTADGDGVPVWHARPGCTT